MLGFWIYLPPDPDKHNVSMVVHKDTAITLLKNVGQMENQGTISDELIEELQDGFDRDQHK